jgi:hypothetical protein
MNNPRRTSPWVVAGLVAVCCGGAALLAQSKSDAADGSLAALTAEMRQLRVAIEQLARTQTQTQALAIYLSAQQSRLVQVAGRLDAAQRDLDAATSRSRDAEARLAEMSEALSRTTDPQMRAGLQDGIGGARMELRNADLEVQQAGGRQGELLQMMQFEQSRWNDLTARLEQLIGK